MVLETAEIPIVENHRVYQPEEWLKGPLVKEDSIVARAVLCIEHLINNSFKRKDLRVVEVGPFPVDDDWEHTAPISVLYKRNPDLMCAGFGPLERSEEQIKKTMGDVEYIQGILMPEKISDKYAEKLIHVLGGQPHIIYGQHVFEHSDGCLESMPFGPYKIFEKAAEILEPNGFIVVDNYGGRKGQIGKVSDWEHSKNMRLTHSFMHKEDEGIYVFQKARMNAN